MDFSIVSTLPSPVLTVIFFMCLELFYLFDKHIAFFITEHFSALFWGAVGWCLGGTFITALLLPTGGNIVERHPAAGIITPTYNAGTGFIACFLTVLAAVLFVIVMHVLAIFQHFVVGLILSAYEALTHRKQTVR